MLTLVANDELSKRFDQPVDDLIAILNKADLDAAELKRRADATHLQLAGLKLADLELELSDALRAELSEYLVGALQKLKTIESQNDLYVLVEILAEATADLEAARHVLRDGLDTEPVRSVLPDGRVVLTKGDALRQIEAWCPALTRVQFAELFGVDQRTYARWRLSVAPAEHRAQMVIALSGQLRHSWTDEGVYRWFVRRHPLLNDQPILLLDEVERTRDLVDAAREGRAPVAS